MYLGIDLGTSAVKTILLDDKDQLVGQGEAPLDVSRPEPLWSEQSPEDWWFACEKAVDSLKESVGKSTFAATKAIGLSGQMHGATLLDARDRVLRPAILWNDGRSELECGQLQDRVADLRQITGNLAMPGFTAPKLIWVKNHEAEVFANIRHVLLPKDYLRLRLTGSYASDMSDSSGSLWLDVGARKWSSSLLAACELTEEQMPELYEGSEITAYLRKDVAERWGLEPVPVCAGAGDQAAGAIGTGVIQPGDASLSLGTSGVYFVAADRFQPNPEMALHAFCHALPNAWHQMSVILSAASCLTWISRATGAEYEAALLDEIERDGTPSDRLIFLPYLSGERTPHNDPNAMGVFFGLTHDTSRSELGRAVLEGVAFAFADGQEALTQAGTQINSISVIGGGARSKLWGSIIASVLDKPLIYRLAGEVGPALGAARLARISVTGEAPIDVCTVPPLDEVIEPDAALVDHYRPRLEAFRELYQNLSPTFRKLADL
ncbi:MAG: xylulokinase [Pseudomonadales bacterium]|jgi:xylulokinase|nr:xylulokinase [Pseudomonadales bacterium]MDP7360940.1 xylulokinase [Pseudomonadales bacterium]HJN52053.1 xylulokinase [Pseudomonadales bacterium]|tara:strand:- start:613 stop:2088 length:1476 start_codon:yes stop_codon:yes gene_type:complete